MCGRLILCFLFMAAYWTVYLFNWFSTCHGKFQHNYQNILNFVLIFNNCAVNRFPFSWNVLWNSIFDMMGSELDVPWNTGEKGALWDAPEIGKFLEDCLSMTNSDDEGVETNFSRSRRRRAFEVQPNVNARARYRDYQAG